MRWNIGYFGLKDVFTLINVLGGVGGIYFSVEGNPVYGGYAILAGFLFGDALDGRVARLTGSFNKFGTEFDSAADHIGQGIAPAVVAYAALSALGEPILGLCVMAFLISTATLRQARFNVEGFNYSLCYPGLPRTVSGIMAVALPNATFVREMSGGAWLAAGVLGVMGVLNLAPIPYMTHKGRKLQAWVAALVVLFLATPIVLFFVLRERFYDSVAVFAGAYVLFGWLPVRPDERKGFFAEYRRWAQKVATLK